MQGEGAGGAGLGPAESSSQPPWGDSREARALGRVVVVVYVVVVGRLP